METGHKHFKRLMAIICCVICIVTLVLPIGTYAAEKSGKTVRVAYAISPGYQEGGDGEYKTGYGYEYLQKIAEMNGWKYEYVYGSFNELLEMLESGEVDLMGNLTYSDARAEKISYGDYEEGKESSYLYIRKDDKSIDLDKPSTLNGKKVGVCAGQIQEDELKEWCKKNNVSCEIVKYEYFDDCRKALNKGKIDALMDGGIRINAATEQWNVALKFEAKSFYFAVNKNRTDILEELNSAQKEILAENPYYNDKVQARYLESMEVATTNLNDSEKEWLEQHNGTIRFGYLKGFAPLSYKGADGEGEGVAADALASMQRKYKDEDIEIESVAYTDYSTMFQDLRDGKIDTAWPAYDDYWHAEENGQAITDRVIDTSMMLVYEGKYTEFTTKRIGVINTGSLPKIYAEIHYPGSEIREYDSYDDAIQAVVSGEVSSILYVSTTYNVHVLTNRVLQSLNMAVLPDEFGISMAVSHDNVALNSLLNKGIAAFGDAGVGRSLIVHSAVDKDVTLGDYFAQHPFIGALILVMILGFVAAILFLTGFERMTLRIKASQAEKEIYEKLSNSDPLTGLYNRKKVFQRCSELLEEYPDEQFVMAHIDMKHFRLYNTFFGDEAGDKLLCDVAELFRGMSADYDYWTYGRIEADVFCLFFPYDEKKYIKHFNDAMEYLRNYRADYLIEPAIGVYFVKDRDMAIESMFTRASMAAKEVKPATPYATVVYNEKLENDLNEKQQIINDMQMAIDQEQFKVYLQPKYSLRNNQLVGVEALARWVHPTKGLVSPGKFIPVFEGNGFITSLDRYMWEHVCQLLAKWKKEYENVVPVSVNVSRLSMFSPSTVDYLKELVKKYDIEPRLLELELTETVYMDNPEEMKQQMLALRDAGFTLLMDDFGSGYSSLNTLRELPVDVLKLDMKLMSMSSKDIRGRLVLSSIVRMSKLLNLVVIAEGVEHQEQADFLKGIGCEYVQGYLFARPMPVDNYEMLQKSGGAPVTQVNQPAIEHISKIIAEMGTQTYAMGTVMPAPLACVEYVNNNFDFLRVNPDFYREFSLEKDMDIASAFIKHLSGTSRLALTEAFENSSRTGERTMAQIEWNTDEGEKRHYMCSVAYEGNIGISAAIVVVFTNITDAIVSEDGELMRNRVVMSKALWGCVRSILVTDDVTASTNYILRDVINYYDADRAYIFEFDWDKRICDNTYEICAPGVNPEIESLQNIPIETIDGWIKVFNEKSMISIKDINELVGDESRRDEYEILAPQGIKSLLAVPVYFDDKLVGFLGVDNPNGNLDDTVFLENVAFLCLNESMREKAKASLEDMSMHDILTGAFNRKAWEDRHRKLVRTNTPFSVLMMDVDDYKIINDTYGHQVGDELLKHVVDAVKKVFRSDDMVIRYGGDEFIVILENTDSSIEDVLKMKIEALNAQLSKSSDKVPSVTVSVGIAFSDCCDAEELYNNADAALYYVKHHGKKGYHVYNADNRAEYIQVTQLQSPETYNADSEV